MAAKKEFVPEIFFRLDGKPGPADYYVDSTGAERPLDRSDVAPTYTTDGKGSYRPIEASPSSQPQSLDEAGLGGNRPLRPSVVRRKQAASLKIEKLSEILDVPEVVFFGVGLIVTTDSERTRILSKIQTKLSRLNEDQLVRADKMLSALMG